MTPTPLRLARSAGPQPLEGLSVWPLAREDRALSGRTSHNRSAVPPRPGVMAV